MAVIGGPNSNFEELFRQSMTGLNKSIEFRTERISKILTDAYQNADISAKYWRTVRQQIDVQYRVMDKLYKNWAKKNIPLAYRASVKELMTRLDRSKRIAKQANRSFVDIVTGSKSMQIQSILVRDAALDWNSALKLGQQNISSVTRRTQQILVRESLIDSSVARAIESGNLMNNTFIKAINLPNSLAAQMNSISKTIDGQKYVIAGARKFKPKYYAEMVTRVKFHEAQAQAAVITAANHGTSLVHVSAHNTDTEICQQFEGKVFSIKGKDERFPLLVDVPPYHVNCLHLLFPMFESSMEVEGTLDDWVAFSNGKVSKPPSPANFKPISKREVS